MAGAFWPRPRYPNQAAALSGYVGIGAPLLAAFELAAIVTVLTEEKSPALVPWAGPALAAMCVSLVCMIFSIQYGFWAVSFWNGPGDRLAWNPAAAVDLGELDRERHNLAHHRHLFTLIGKLAERLFRLGLAFALVAVVCLLLPPEASSGAGASAEPPNLATDAGVSRWRAVAAGVVALGIAVEVLWLGSDLAGSGLARLRRRLVAGARPPVGAPRRYASAAVGVLETAAWHVGRPFLPPRWREPYLPVGPPQPAGVRALAAGAPPLPPDLGVALAGWPAEWPPEAVSWADGHTVLLFRKPLAGLVWADWPWAVAGVPGEVTVVHPLGVVRGDPARVAARLRPLAGHFTGRRRRGQLDRQRLAAVQEHLAHLAGDTGTATTRRR